MPRKTLLILTLAMLPIITVWAVYPSAMPTPSPVPSRARFLSATNGQFIDTYGRQVILHGVNLVNKSKASGYIGGETLEDFARMADWGFNCIRLGVIWDGLEPEPGKFNEEYLRRVDEQIRLAKRHGLYVLLDMHQDLFSVKFSDGAPEWATLDEGLPHVAPGEVWSDAYFTSPAVQKAFDNFWGNKPASDGVGVQEHFARAWAHVARRYADEPAIIGYDLMNEPFEGTAGAQAYGQLLAKLAEIVAPREGLDVGPETVRKRLMAPEGRPELMRALGDMALFQQLVDFAEPASQEFERTKLMPMYGRVARAIREVDRHHILFLEPGISTNSGVRSALTPINGPDGRPDPLLAYAPHGYDIVTDTPDVAQANNQRVELIFSRHAEAAQRLSLPMMVGEWGAYYNSLQAYPAARFVSSQFEKRLASDTYWSYTKDLVNAAFLPAIVRPYPMEISGTLVSYASDFDARKFTAVWKESLNITAPTRIYLPNAFFTNRHRIKLDPKGIGYKLEFSGREGNQYLIIPPTGKAVERRLSTFPAP
jgi:endoglycosylceramidase